MTADDAELTGLPDPDRLNVDPPAVDVDEDNDPTVVPEDTRA